jgi:hypothetical protein
LNQNPSHYGFAGQPRLAYGDKGEEGRYEVSQIGDSIISSDFEL